jgi:Circadian oscillating protein COP23
MNTKPWSVVLVATTVLVPVSINIFNQSGNAKTIVAQSGTSNSAAKYPKDRISFYCGEISDKANGGTIPATIAYVPQRKVNVAIIAWKYNYVPKWDTQKRCETVSPKFQTFYENGRLNYLTTGKNQGYDIICAAVETGQACKAEDQLFQVKASSDPGAVLKRLTGIIEGTSSQPIYQRSSQQIYVSVEELLKTAPAIENADLTSK